MTDWLRLKHLWFGLSLVIGLEAVSLPAQPTRWEPVGLSGGGGMFTPAISPADPNLMLLNCDMSAAYLSEDGGHNWRMINHAQLRSDTSCRPAFHPTDANIIYASSGQTAVVVPYEIAGQAATQVVVEYQGVQSSQVSVQVAAVAPGIFTVLFNGTGQGRC